MLIPFRHVQMDFWPQFCSKAGVFCIGEVFGGIDIAYVVRKAPPPLWNSSNFIPSPIAQYQGPQALDSVLNFPMYSALVEAFAIPGPRNVTALANVIQQSKTSFKVLSFIWLFRMSSHRPFRILACWATSLRIRISHAGITNPLIPKVYSRCRIRVDELSNWQLF